MRGPKFWDGEYVKTGAPLLRSQELPLDSLLGKYQFICWWSSVTSNDMNYDVHNQGNLSLTLKPGSKLDPSNVTCTIALWGDNGIPTTLKKSSRSNVWFIPKITHDEATKKHLKASGYEFINNEKDDENHQIHVTDVKDDNGNQFILFQLNMGKEGSWTSSDVWLGRKMIDGQKERPLSEAELKRLHWKIDEKSLKAQFLRPTWSENRDRALKDGSMPSNANINLSSICGFYRFVWDDATNMINWQDCDDETTFLNLDPPKSGNSQVSGTFLWYRKICTFASLSRDENQSTNYFDFESVKWFGWDGSDYKELDLDNLGSIVDDEGEEEERQLFGHGISILEVLDDNGFPFIELIYNEGSSIVRALGKKQSKGGGVPGELTTGEIKRLVKAGVAMLYDNIPMNGWDSDVDDEQGPTRAVGGMKRKADGEDSEEEPLEGRASKRQA